MKHPFDKYDIKASYMVYPIPHFLRIIKKNYDDDNIEH